MSWAGNEWDNAFPQNNLTLGDFIRLDMALKQGSPKGSLRLPKMTKKNGHLWFLDKITE